MKLYGYWRSSATYRLRIALGLKGLAADYRPVNLLKGEQRDPAFLTISPQGLLPVFVTDTGATLTQSLAVIEYLDETVPSPPLLPKEPLARARARQIAYAIACEAQPLQNLRIQSYLRDDAELGEDGVRRWLDRWVGGAMRAVETMLEETAGACCVGDEPTLADICLVPQVYAAQRFKVDLSDCPRLLAIDRRCAAHPAFIAAHPDNQPDAVRG